jgi:succinate dehydrogenase / fumarate reductase, cytochrome b subunit
MSTHESFFSSTIGKKVTMAISGLILVGFVISHMLGNLKIFLGKNAASGAYLFDEYAHSLREMGAHFFGYSGLLWVARAVLLIAVILHAYSGITLARLNRRAKRTPAYKPQYDSANAASRTMYYGGLFLALFIVYHLLHLTTGTVHTRGFVEGQVYSNVTRGFQSLPIAGVYVLAMAFLGLHLYHGTWSMFQTLGVDSPKWNPTLRLAAKTISVLLFLGFSSVPISVAAGILPLP